MELASKYNKPTKPVKVISLSPLARIFQPYHKIEPYLEDPDLVYAEKSPFDIVIQGSWTTQKLRSGEVHLIDSGLAFSYVGHDNERFSKEYGGTGLVYFDVPDDVAVAMEFAAKTKAKLPAEIRKKLTEHLDHFRKLSHGRVLAHAKTLYNTMVAGRNQVREAGKEPPAPNDMELLIAFILREEIKRSKTKRTKLTQNFEEAAREISGDLDLLVG